MYIEGGTGTGRGIVGSNFGKLSAENNSVSDHAFGRGFDIMAVGTTSSEIINLVTSIDDYRKGLNIFLTNLQVLSKDLHPDLIIIHDQLAEEFGILESGLEDANAAIRKKYPHLGTFINFGVDSSHRNHIHISYSPQRSGSFITPAVAAQLTGTTPTGFDSNGTVSLDKFKANYFDKTSDTLSPDEVMYLLSTSGIFSDEVSAIFVGIGERESNWRPGALNEVKKAGSGDFSFGAFQCNLLPAAHGSKKFILKYNASGQPYDDLVLGYKLAYAIDSDNNAESLSKKVLEKSSRSTIDKRIFVPYNQAWMLGTVAAGEAEVAKAIKRSVGLDSYLFHAWGDYDVVENGEKVPRSDCGFIFKVKFSTVLAAYKLKGKSEESLKSWIRSKFKNKRPYPYIEKWMSGTVFSSEGTEL